MVRRPAISAAALFLVFTGGSALCQVTSPGNSSTQIRKEWELGRASDDLGKKDGTIPDPLGYLQSLTGRIVIAAAVKPVRISLTRSAAVYMSPLPSRAIFLSAGLLVRIEDEAGLAGLIAHALAHLAQRRPDPLSMDLCPLAPGFTSATPEESRDRERLATETAVPYLKAAGYDPLSLLSLLSELSFEHPDWSKVIASGDLLDLRVKLEGETVPPKGYQLDSSAFIRFRGAVKAEKLTDH